MRNAIVAVALVAAVLSGVLRTGVQADDEAINSKQVPVHTRIYQVKDLPLYTDKNEFAPELLMTLIQKTVTPTDWQADGGTSTMAPYPQMTALVISTTSKNHDKISELLEAVRGDE